MKRIYAAVSGGVTAMEHEGVLARVDSLRILEKWMGDGSFPDRMIASIPANRRGFVMDLVYTTVRNARLLDAVIRPCVCHTPDNHAMAALLMGACQIFKMADVPPHAAVHATVEAYKHVAGENRTGAGFVNAVLRKLLRGEPGVRQSIREMPLAVRESHNDSQVKRWTEKFGPDIAEKLCEWDNIPANLTVLAIPGGPSVDELRKEFAECGIEAVPHSTMPSDCLVIPHGFKAESLPGFRDGRFSIQDPATLTAVRMLEVEPDMRVLDACAAPGGKSVQAALRLCGRGSMVAMESRKDRLEILKDTISRFKLGGIIEVVCGDAMSATPNSVGGGFFDRILLDVPCSNTGVQRRRADVRWRFDVGRLKTLAEIQIRILENMAGFLADGGRIVYSTCSIEDEENGKVTGEFLARHPEFKLVEERLLIPPVSGTDGAYSAALERT